MGVLGSTEPDRCDPASETLINDAAILALIAAALYM